ncbi:unnamed protein product [Pocillopora meandrina]|uniref:Uncharacterized protein n=1 Tax=Pocillopora meandrina TaxID=46732 RepID=A0AAU9XKA4_9CNID|nr:unnamed protein product [Pocillopora meandrina]
MESRLEFRFGIDLVEAALAQRHPELNTLDELCSRLKFPPGRRKMIQKLVNVKRKNLVNKYELLWFPLLAQYVTRIKKWSIALGVACAHAVPCRLPERLQLNCLYSVGTQHNLRATPERAYKGQALPRALWGDLDPEEPFKVELTAPVDKAPDFKSRIEYDIEAACARQRVFNYQVSLPHFADNKFLIEALERLILGKVFDHNNDSIEQPTARVKTKQVTRKEWKNPGH